jgi:hypothetical protein
MNWSKIAAVAAAGCLSAMVAGTAARAAEIVVMFERTSGHKVTMEPRHRGS